VIVATHQAVREHRRIEARRGFVQDRELDHSIGVVTVDGLAAITAR
jgi:hypothetical protein